MARALNVDRATISRDYRAILGEINLHPDKIPCPCCGRSVQRDRLTFPRGLAELLGPERLRELAAELDGTMPRAGTDSATTHRRRRPG